MRIAALDIGGTSIKSGIWNGQELAEVREQDTGAKKGAAHVVNQVLEILESYGPFDGVGISTAGQVDSREGYIRYANENIPGYTGTRLKDITVSRFGVPVAVENDVNSAALGREGHPFCGCYEKYASATALVEEAIKYDRSLTNGRQIFARFHEPEVHAIVDRWIDEVVHGLVTIIHIFNPSCVILGGGVMEQPYILEQVRGRTADRIMDSFRNVELKTAALGNRAGLMGASRLAMEQMKKT